MTRTLFRILDSSRSLDALTCMSLNLSVAEAKRYGLSKNEVMQVCYTIFRSTIVPHFLSSKACIKSFPLILLCFLSRYMYATFSMLMPSLMFDVQALHRPPRFSQSLYIEPSPFTYIRAPTPPCNCQGSIELLLRSSGSVLIWALPFPFLRHVRDHLI